jgi:hypothetical protein
MLSATIIPSRGSSASRKAASPAFALSPDLARSTALSLTPSLIPQTMDAAVAGGGARAALSVAWIAVIFSLLAIVMIGCAIMAARRWKGESTLPDDPLEEEQLSTSNELEPELEGEMDIENPLVSDDDFDSKYETGSDKCDESMPILL